MVRADEKISMTLFDSSTLRERQTTIPPNVRYLDVKD